MVFVSFSGLGDLLCILIITIDRYLYINLPLRYPSIVTRTKALILSTIIILCVLVFSLWGVTRTNVGRPCISIRSANGDVFRFFIIPLLDLILSLVVMTYGKIAFVAWKARNADVQQSHPNSQSETQNKMTKVMSLVIGVFSMTYVTYFVTYFATLGKEERHIIMIQSVAIWIWQVRYFLIINNQWRIHDFPEEGALTQKGLFGQFFPKTA